MGSTISTTRKTSPEELHARVEELEQTNRRQEEEKQALTAKVDALLLQHEELKSFCQNMQQEYHHHLRHQPQSGGIAHGQFEGLFDDEDNMPIIATKGEAETMGDQSLIPCGGAANHHHFQHGSTQAFGAHFEPVVFDRHSVTPSPSKCSNRSSVASDNETDGERPARLSALSRDDLGEAVRIEETISGMQVEYKKTQILLNNPRTSDETGSSVEMEIIRQFYPARSRPASLWEHEHVHNAWIPSLLCRHCVGGESTSGNSDACVQLQRRFGKTLSFCLEHVKVCRPDVIRECVVPSSPSNDLEKMLRKDLEAMFGEEESVSDASSVSLDSDVDTSGKESKAKATDMTQRLETPSLALIDDRWHQGVLESTLYIMEQMMPWYIRESDCQNLSILSGCTPGSRTLLCRHCLAFQSFSSCETAAKYFHYGHRHLLTTCAHCPEEVKKKIVRLRKENFRKPDRKRELLVNVFDRLHQLNRTQMTRAQDDAILRLETSLGSDEGDDSSYNSERPVRAGNKRRISDLQSQKQSKKPNIAHNGKEASTSTNVLSGPILGASLSVGILSHASDMAQDDLHSIGDITNDWGPLHEDFLGEM